MTYESNRTPLPNTYQNYLAWKGWGGESPVPGWLARAFSKELERAGVTKPSKVLEVGFGNGEFLAWASSTGHEATGVEIIPELVDSATAKGLRAFLLDCTRANPSVSPMGESRFDLIVALDVIEHLTEAQAKAALTFLASHLQQGGKILLRFPNGESPFSLPLQNGDPTHRMYVTRVKLEHICLGTGLRVVSYANAARVVNRRSLAPLKWMTFRLRDLTEIFLGFTYYTKRRPLDPAAVARLERLPPDA